MTDAGLWNLAVAPTAQRDLARIPRRYAVAIIEFVTAVLPTNPNRLGKPLRGELTGLHSARRGDYRVLYVLDTESRRILVVRVDHRARVSRQA